MNHLSIENLNFAYAKQQVLFDINISEIESGTLVALIGPNASGKSTLFKCLAGINTIQSGKILLGDEDLSKLALKNRLNKICFMPQLFSANAALSVFEVVLMSYKQLQGWRVSHDDRLAVANILKFAGIGHLAGKNIAELSGGQMQMVSLCQALVRKAEVYLFDEPTSALDLRHQLEALSYIREQMKSRGSIGIVALHDLNLAARFADHFLLLGQGRLLGEGSPFDVLKKEAISQTYGVNIDILVSKQNTLHVSAFL